MVTLEERFEHLEKTIRGYNISADLKLVEAAYSYAREHHGAQLRRDGTPYITHPIQVAQIVAEMRLDSESILAALLHDCIEDTDSTYEDIAKRFGVTVADIVDGVTKLTRVKYSTMEEEQMENLRKMLFAMSRDIRVILIKIADRLHNMRTMEYQTPVKQKKKAFETMEIYAPIAHRLGMQKIKWELEDLSLKYLDPVAYDDIARKLEIAKSEHGQFMSAVTAAVNARMTEQGIPNATVYGRVKHPYSIYRKMYAQEKTMEEVYDLFAFRVLVDTVPDCYNVLGVIHDLYKPILGRFKDYIATPKPNMYQSLHTTVIGDEGIPFEVQIRTYDMHAIAEYGVAAHWKYKQGIKKQGGEGTYEWIRRLLENQEDADAEDFIHSLKVDMFSDEVFVFTPTGDLRKLPEGATLLDFAFDIHSGLGSTCVGGRGNNRAASIRDVLRNGDIVEIQTQKNQTPKSDWLNFVVTSKARNKIKSFLREEQAKHTRMGREELERKLKNWKFPLTIDEAVAYLVKYFKVRTGTEIYALIATQKVDLGTIKEILTRHISGEADEQRRAAAAEAERNKVHNAKESPAAQDALVIDDDISKIQYKLAKCCNPIKGDEVFGFVTINSGITIHRCDCPNAKRMRENYPYRVIDARWRSTAEGAFRVSLRIVAADTTGMANHITEVISRDLKLNIRSINFASLANGCIAGTVSVEVPGAGVVDTLIHSIMRIKGVQRAFRINN